MASAGHRPNRKTSRRRNPAAADPGDPVPPPGPRPSRTRLALLLVSSALLIGWVSYLAVLAVWER